MIRLDCLERIDGGRLRLANHLNGRLGAHAGPLSRLQRRVLCGIGPDGGTGEDKVHFGAGHKGLAIAACQRVHGVTVDLSEVVTNGVQDRLVEFLELGGSLEAGDVKGEFLRAIQKQLDASQASLLGAELEAPFHGGLGARRRIGGESIRDLGGHLVRGDAVAAGPCLDDLYVVRVGRIHGGDAREGGSKVDADNQAVGDGGKVPDGLSDGPIDGLGGGGGQRVAGEVVPAVLVPLVGWLRGGRADRKVDAHGGGGRRPGEGLDNEQTRRSIHARMFLPFLCRCNDVVRQRKHEVSNTDDLVLRSPEYVPS